MKEQDLKVKTVHSHAKQAVLLYPYLPFKDEAQTAVPRCKHFSSRL